MLIVRTKQELARAIVDLRGPGERIGVVPTMGALHEGHLSLVDAAGQRADRVIVTIFVNPKQFNSANDLAHYPRTEASDLATLATRKVDIVYIPAVPELYPDGFSTNVSVKGLSDGLCGESRPGHFDGVATVVTKLLVQTRADLAFFGEKDYQQLQIIRRLVRDLDLRVEIIGCPTVRQEDGLALSSRNARLSGRALRQAPALYRALREAASRLETGDCLTDAWAAAATVILAADYTAIDYLELRDADDLAPLVRADRPARLFCAAWIESVRLIDNVPVGRARPSQSSASTTRSLALA